MIAAIEKNLQKAIYLLTTISEEEYRDNSIKPYYSSIGGHIRHIMDMFDCIFQVNEMGEIDLTARKRNVQAEQEIKVGLAYVTSTISKLKSIKNEDLTLQVFVTDDLGLGKITVPSTLAAILAQANSHATHHYASIGYIINYLGIELPDEDFGFNPTTPKKIAVNS